MVLKQINHYDSSMIESSSYDFKHQILTVHFKGATYVYHGVDAQTHSDFATADSQGQALNKFIKGKFEFEKINVETKQEENV